MKDFMNAAKAVADENRARIILFLRHGELCVCQIIELLTLAPSTVSKHLSILHHAGLIESRKQGRWIYYRLPRATDASAHAETIRWVVKGLERDPAVIADAKRLQVVRRRSADSFCCHYHKEK